MMVKSIFYVTLIINYFSITMIFLDNYDLHAKYHIFNINMINTQLISGPEKVCVFMITKPHNWSVLVELLLMLFIRHDIVLKKSFVLV